MTEPNAREQETTAFLAEVRETLESMEGDREGILEYMMELGDELDELDPARRTAENLVPGCVSQVHIEAELGDDHTLQFEGSSQSLIVKGFVFVLVDGFTGWSPRAFLERGQPLLDEFLESTRLGVATVPSRVNALGNIVLSMRKRAQQLNELLGDGDGD